MDWEPITIKRNDDTVYYGELESDQEDERRNYKTLCPDSRRLLIEKRVAKNLRQYEVYFICNFPVNTTNKIEMEKVVPNPKQLNALKRLFRCALKYAK